MRFFTAILPLFGAAFVSARSLSGGTQQTLNTLNPAFKVPGDNPLEFCADPKEYPGTVDYVNLTPNPPVPGENLHISVAGTLNEDIDEGATVQLRVKIGEWITLINKTYDLCEALPKIGKECPLKKGELTVERDAAIPGFVPPGTYNVFANVLSKGGDVIVCMEATVTFSV